VGVAFPPPEHAATASKTSRTPYLHIGFGPSLACSEP
jgi:hypothetical protein